MGVYFGETEITNIDNLVPQTMQDITQAFFGSTEIFTVWAEYDGALPAQYTANGSALADYRIYGASGGVGDETPNLFDKNNLRSTNCTLNEHGTMYINGSCAVSDFIPIDGGNTYYIINADVAAFCWYDEEQEYISGERYNDRQQFATTAPQNAAYIRCTVTTETSTGTTRNLDTFKVTNGYGIAMSVSDGTTSTTTPIYIGSSPLSENEYVDYGEQKVYRRTDNLCDGIFINGSLTADGYIPADNRIVSENYLKIDELTITLSSQTANCETIVFYYNASKEYVGQSTVSGIGWRALPATVTATNDTKYVRIILRKSDNTMINPSEIQNVMLNSGSTAKSYQPYLQPTDPPVPLPALPTVDGTTITDYAGQSAAVPSRLYAKYRKEGF